MNGSYFDTKRNRKRLATRLCFDGLLNRRTLIWQNRREVMTDVCFHGSRIISGGSTGTIYISSMRHKQQNHISFSAHSKGINRIVTTSFSGNLLTASDDMSVRMWDLNRPDEIHPLRTLPEHHSFVVDCTSSYSTKEIATISLDRHLRLWPENQLEIHKKIRLNQQPSTILWNRIDDRFIHIGYMGKKQSTLISNAINNILKIPNAIQSINIDTICSNLIC
eukprot:TRINITY_DN7835_c0_g1_i1.p1 TRINITY_DN7835_c0_g1~~TRINITY_DN7835_c0_g1_i1.p1  ORF type:complete len:221 (+),score=36.67 TRINITY_DN7835_c0_g1_i1:56-718(+)